MNKKLSTLFILYSFCTTAKAQQPIEFLNKLSENNPIQKIYLHLDRENYSAGETVHFKAYLSADFLPDTSNSTMYIELLDGMASITKAVFPIFFSAARGSITLPDTLARGYYTIRAFSTSMIVQNEEYFFNKKIYVYGTEKKQAVVAKDSVQLAFFPEGGNLVNGLASTVAFKATNKNGIAEDIVGNVYNSKDAPIIYFSCLHDGMGIFDIKPQAGEKYYIKLKTNNTSVKYYLPEVLDKGVTIALSLETGGNSYEIRQKESDGIFEAAYMIGQIQHHVVFKKTFSKFENVLSGFIDTKNLPSGIMQITVFNKEHIPLAERLVFVNNKEYLLETKLQTDTLDFSAGGRNKFFIAIKDTVQGQISVSITDEFFELRNENGKEKRESNIVSSLLLTSDLSGHIYNPAFYLSSTDDSIKNALYILMMVNGWRRFKWNEMGSNQNSRKPSKGFITLSGSIVLEGTKRPFANKTMMLLITPSFNKNKRNNVLFETDSYGMFKIDSLVMFDKNKLLFIDIMGKKSKSVDVYLNTDTLFAGVRLPKKNWFSFKYKFEGLNAQTQIDFENAKKANGVLLQEVVVKSKAKSKKTVLEDRYVSGLFNSDARTTIDLVNSDDASNYANIFDYLRVNVNGVQVANDGSSYKLFYRSNAGGNNNSPMTIYLDEIETDASSIEGIPANQIALVKVYSTFLGGMGNSADGAIAIYTKKADDLQNASLSNYNIKIYKGYTISKEFFAPNYKTSKTGLDTDTRITIDWRPQIFVNNINPKIPISFYNNNRTKCFKVVVEGMANTGKLIWIEKTITQ